MVDRFAAQPPRRHRAGAAGPVKLALALLRALVLLRIVFRRRLVVAGQRLVGGVGHALFQRIEAEHAEQRVAAADVGVEETQGLPRGNALDPQRHLGELHRHRIAIDPVNAAADHIAQRRLLVGRVGVAQGRDLARHPPRGAEQEMPRSARRVDHLQVQDGASCFFRRAAVRLGMVEHRIERTVEQRLDQAVGGIIAAAGLARIALRPRIQAERAVGREEGPDLEQALVDAAQLLRPHVAPVDARPDRVHRDEPQAPDRAQEATVGDARRRHRRRAAAREQPAERGKAEHRLPLLQRRKSDLHPLPRIVMRVVCRAPRGSLAPEGEGIARLIERTRPLPGVTGVEQVALLRHREEDQAIDGAQQLLEQPHRRSGIGGELVADRRIGVDQPLPQLGERRLDALAQPLARGGALFQPRLARLLQRGVRRRRARGAEAAGVREKPPGGEIREHLVAEHRAQIGLDPRRTRQAGIVTHQPHAIAREDETPVEGRVGVEPVLQQHDRRPASAALLPIAELGQRAGEAGEARALP